MAKLGYYFSLCPLIDQNNLLGVNDDATSGNVIVTLGEKIVINYQISNQKQLHSWRTKDKFTSPVIYDKKTEKYYGVFNHIFLRSWTTGDVIIDKLRKDKFFKPLQTLLSIEQNSFVVFQNGCINTLEKTLDDNDPIPLNDVLNENEKIVDILTFKYNDYIYIGLILQSETTVLQWSCFSNGDTISVNNRININSNGVNASLSGYVLTNIGDNSINLLTIWSNGKMSKYPLQEEDAQWEYFGLFDSLACERNLTITALDDDYIAIYGADNDHEGASLIIYNIQFKIRQSRMPMKMFTNKNRVWCLQNNLFLCIGQNLGVVPYHLDNEQISALVGTLENRDNDVEIIEELLVTNWDGSKNRLKRSRWERNMCEEVTNYDGLDQKNVPDSKLEGGFKNLLKQGYSERKICEEVFPNYIKKKDIDSIIEAISYFSDIPEEYTVKLLNFALNVESGVFTDLRRNIGKKQTPKAVPLPLRPIHRCDLLDKILEIRYSEKSMIQELQTRLDLTSSLLLLRYICYMLSEDGHHTSDYLEPKLIDWGCVLLDANYQKLILTRDDKAIELLQYLSNLVTAKLCGIEEFTQLLPILFDAERAIAESRQSDATSNKPIMQIDYSIERLSLL